MADLIVALGPGEPELVPAASLAALTRAGACALHGASDALAAAVREAGVAIDAGAAVVAAPDGEARRLALAAPDAPTVPARPLLLRQGAAHAAGALLELTARLRRDCPWDRAQDERSIVPHTVEEAYEVAQAARDDGLGPELIDELGDLLFQTTFLALLCEEQDRGAWADVAAGVTDKLIRRHPHVFGDVEHGTAGEVKQGWEARKRSHEDREGIFHDVPEVLPALLLAAKIQRRAASIGFEYPDAEGAFADLRSEIAELDDELARRLPPAPEEPGDPEVDAELGDVLFAAVNVARRWNTDPELALRDAAARFRTRVERAEALAGADGVEFATAGLERQEGYYQAAKRALAGGRGGSG